MKHLDKYWYNRFQIFSKFNEGIQLDDEGWFSTTHENIAKCIARKSKGYSTVLDGFAGCGGNVIQYAKKCSTVYAVDID